MLDLADIKELPRHIALAIPIAVLVTLIALLWVGARRHKARARQVIIAPAAEPSNVKVKLTMSMLDAAPLKSRTSPPPVDAKARKADAQRRIKTASETIDGPKLPAIYLELADALKSLGDDDARMTALRSAAGLAAKHGVRKEHARARLELAEAAVATGDLTSACEQWQLARSALIEDGATAEAARVDQRMRDTGCPTDWVLTDF
ncbi:MAG: hypothetical protein ACT4OU_06160 [Hyphomicrobium sp.]